MILKHQPVYIIIPVSLFWKSIYLMSTISGAQKLHGLLLHFLWGEGSLTGYAMSDARKKGI